MGPSWPLQYGCAFPNVGYIYRYLEKTWERIFVVIFVRVVLFEGWHTLLTGQQLISFRDVVRVHGILEIGKGWGELDHSIRHLFEFYCALIKSYYLL